MLANHAKEGLPAADIQVIRRGKALEYFSRHYGKVLVEEGRSLSVTQALVGINQLIEEETDVAADLPPVNAECQSARGPDADRRAKLLTYQAVEGAILKAFSQR
ncbi:hypothetical protein ACVWYH_003375 [Bradyrhizobium sp. GM24.11]